MDDVTRAGVAFSTGKLSSECAALLGGFTSSVEADSQLTSLPPLPITAPRAARRERAAAEVGRGGPRWGRVGRRADLVRRVFFVAAFVRTVDRSNGRSVDRSIG